MISREKVQEIHRLAWAARTDQPLPEVFTSMAELVATLQHDYPAAAALRKLVEGLPREELFDLAALVWWGRGDFLEFSEARDHAAVMQVSPEYILEKPLHDYLGEVVGLL